MVAGNGRVEREEEEAKNVRRFREQMLPLSFFEDIIDDQKVEKKLTEVPVHFVNENQYIDIMLPLWLEEVKMQIHRAKTMEMSKESEEVEMGKFSLDGDFLKLDFRRLQISELSQRLCSIGDLILLLPQKVTATEAIKETKLHMLGLVDNSVHNTLTVYVAPGDLKNAKEGSRAYMITQAIKAKKPWHLMKVAGMATAFREFEALHALPRIALRSLIVNADTAAPAAASTDMQAAPEVAGINEDGGAGADAAKTDAAPMPVKEEVQPLVIPDQLEKYFEGKYNGSQLKAIRDSCKVAGITLVQGPPGTGKTTTILGILGMLLNARTTIAKGVSYTRTDQKRKNGAVVDESSSESEFETDEVIQERKRRRVGLLRARAPWFNRGYVPWADQLEQKLPGSEVTASSVAYPTISQNSIVAMSEIRHEERPQKVLVCAPSNAAIDEVLRRAVKEGVVNETCAVRKPSIIRVGPNLHASLADYSLEKLARKKTAAQADQKNTNVYEDEKSRIMKSVQIVCTTLSIAGSRDLVGYPEDFDTVIIDEASQGLELSTLVPLKLGCRRLILVGDPQQLPATCFSAVSLAHKYERSLFQRLQLSFHKVNMLDEQFRMHPAISKFPSTTFYDGLLKNVREKEEFEKAFPAPWSEINCFGPVCFFHMRGSQEKSRQSLVNVDEASFVLQLYISLSQLYPPEASWRSRVAVISPYAEQVELIRAKFRLFFSLGRKDPCPIDVNTVDGFQGREKDIIIVSTVRADPEQNSIGFVRDRRRMNVAMTRARLNLWVIGHASVLNINHDWALFIAMQQENCRFLNVSQPSDRFMSRYLVDWYARHPEKTRPVAEMFDELAAADAKEAENGGKLADDAAELSDVEPAEGVADSRDLEEVSDEDAWDDGIGAADSDDEFNNMVHEGAKPALINAEDKVGDDPVGDDE